ncbi:MAG: hypothetical protein K5894_05750 [Lachnospiraceae bacterium]|nr:hypothetical protein [Lachnospiraceae bacterium]
MINSIAIKKILGQVPAGTTLSVSQIQNFVSNKYPLSAEDWDVYTTTRQTHYCKWKHKIQSVLHEYKEKKILEHNPSTCSYTF